MAMKMDVNMWGEAMRHPIFRHVLISRVPRPFARLNTMPADALDLPALLARYERPLVRYSWSILGDLEAARDVVQETFIRLCRREDSGDGTHTEAWLFTVTRNLSIDHQRKQRRIIYMPQTDDRTTDEPAPGALKSNNSCATIPPPPQNSKPRAPLPRNSAPGSRPSARKDCIRRSARRSSRASPSGGREM